MFPPGTRFLDGGLDRLRAAVTDGADAPFDVVFFDMDGTLVDEMSSWEFVHEHFEVSNLANWERYGRGEIDDAEFIRSDIALWGIAERPIHVDDVRKVLEKAPLMKNAEKVVRALRDRGVSTGIVSGGLDLLSGRVATDLGMDFHLANELVLDEAGYLVGEGVVHVPIRDKGTPTRRFAVEARVGKARAAAVGNSEWDVTMFRETGFGVAVNPFDDGVRKGAHVVVEGRDLLPVLDALLRRR